MVNLNCTAFVAMLSAFDGTSQSIEPWKVLNDVGTNYYGTAKGHNLAEALAEGWYLTADQIAHEKVYGTGQCGSIHYGNVLQQRDDEIERVTSNATVNGLRSILYFINEGKGSGQIMVKDGQIHYQGISGDDVNLEPFLEKYNPDSDSSIIDVFFAATVSEPDSPGSPIDIQNFGDVVLMMADGGKTGELEGPGSCYAELQSVKGWVSGLQSCGSRAVQNMIRAKGSTCPNSASCLYVRQGSRKQQSASFSFGFDSTAVQQVSCNNFALRAAALA